MTDELKSKMTDTAKGFLPWQKGVAWWVVLIEGTVLLLLGLYMFFATTPTYIFLGWIVALCLGISGGVRVYLAFRMAASDKARMWTLIYGAIGLITAVLVIVILLIGIYLNSLGLTILGLGCLGYGAVGIFLTVRKDFGGAHRIALIPSILYLLLGILTILHLLGVGTLVATIQWMNLIILVAGIALLIWAFILKREGSSKSATS